MKTATIVKALPALLLLLTGSALAGTIDITLLHLNDIYEITPVSGGKAGGPARVATLRRQLLAENPHTYAILAGDCLSPSALIDQLKRRWPETAP